MKTISQRAILRREDENYSETWKLETPKELHDIVRKPFLISGVVQISRFNCINSTTHVPWVLETEVAVYNSQVDFFWWPNNILHCTVIFSSYY